MTETMPPERTSDKTRLAMIAWSSGALAAIAVIAAARMAQEIVAPTVLAALFAITLSPVVRFLERWRLPSTVASAIVVAAMLFCSILAAYALAPSAEDWRWKAPSMIRSFERKFRDIEHTITEGVERATAGQARGLGGKDSPTDVVIESGQKLVTDTLLSTPQVLLWIIYVTFLCYFLLAERAVLRRAILGLVPNGRLRVRWARTERDIRQNVSSYFLTISAVNLGLGACAALVFWLTGLPNPALWGVMVALLNFMPYLGPMISNIVVFAVGSVSFPNLGEALLPVALLALLNLLEGQVVTPMVVGRGSRISPLAVFLALAFGAWLWGAIGALVATPVLIVAATAWRQLSR